MTNSQKKNRDINALEIYLNQSSSFLSEYSNPAYQGMGATEEDKRVYQNQKVRNQKIVRECKELLSKFEE
ncbi:20290_t:CDS:2 [Funneliformis geosporum]|nr:20290_t:CDS:2 [Funneliformis geosporum]